MKWCIVAEAATNDTLTIQGSISYSGDDNWKDAIRPQSFDCSKIKLVLYTYDRNNELSVKTESLQDIDAEANNHISFVHDGNGGGSFVIKNIPKSIGELVVKQCEIKIDEIAYYESVSSSKISFDETTAPCVCFILSESICFVKGFTGFFTISFRARSGTSAVVINSSFFSNNP